MGIAKRLNLVMVSAFALLLGCLMFNIQPTYALEEKSVSSWSELESNFETADNTITIPEDTIVTVTGELKVPTGEYTITGGGTLQRSDLRAYCMIRINDGSTLNISNITIDGESSSVSYYEASDIGVYGTLNINNVTFKNKSFGDIISGGSNGTAKIEDCTFDNNVDSINFDRGTANISDTNFSNNTGTCIILGNSGTIEGCTFTNNAGNAINLSGGTTQISDCTINGKSNSVIQGKGLYEQYLELQSLDQNSGWEIVAQDTNVDINDCSIKNNELAIYFNHSYGTLNIQDCDLAGEAIKITEGNTKITGGEVSAICSVQSSNELSLVGAKVTDFITCDSISISGNVQITAPVFRTSSNNGYFTITESLGQKAYIVIGGDSTYSFKGAGGDYYNEEYLFIKYLAMPGSGYTITDEDISKFYINRDTSAWTTSGGSNNLSQEEVNALNIVTYSDLYSEYGKAHVTDGNIYMWSGPKLREENIPDTGDDEEQDPTTPSNPGETSGNMSIYGTVQPITMIDVTVPLTIQFTIESDRTFTGPDSIEIKSNCPSPLDVNLYGVNKDDGAPSLVAPDTHSDDEWNNLTRAQTLASIALMLDDTSLSSTGSTLGRIDSAFQSEQALDLGLSAKYGKAWDNSEDLVFTYNVVFEFAMP